jgi:hypothetical protein
LKALSVRQPWAWLIVNGHKQFENRDWQSSNPGRKFRGRVLIHASKGMTRDEYANAYAAVWIINDERSDKSSPGIELPPFDELERGGIVGETEIVAWHDTPPDMPFAFGSGLELTNSKPLPFRPLKGALGFFNVEGGAE